MVEKDELVTCFLEMNISVSDEVLAKCLEICQNYNFDAESFCDQWWAFTASKLSGAPPTLEYLEQLEKKELQKNKSKPPSTPKRPQNWSYSEYVDSKIQSYITPKSATKSSAPIGNGLQTPVIHSPSISANLSVRYSQREDSNRVLLSYGPDTEFKRGNIYPVSIKNASENGSMKDVSYMRETMVAKASTLDYMTDFLGNNIAKKFHLMLTKEILCKKLGAVTTYGRIVSDSDGSLNAHSVLLEGSRESNIGHTTVLNLNNLPTYSLFPGQVVAVEGNKLTSTTLVAEKMYGEVNMDFPPGSPVNNNVPLQIMVAAGPFTLQDNLSYEPLEDLLVQVNKMEPNVLILLGPFLDRTHDLIANGSLNQTFDSFFEGLVEKIVNSIHTGNTRIVMVSSAKDAHHHPIYPTPPYKIREFYNNLTFVSDPCLIDVDGLLIGATTTDVLLHISGFELFVDKSQEYSNKISRIAAHILNQQNFYPLYPAVQEMHIDHGLFTQYGMLEYKPHLLILPSNLRHFVKDIKNCLVINPERLTKGFSSGTYAKVQINPGEGEPVCNRTFCQIVKI